MIECIFTVDYEIYGNGEGSLEELVYEPSEGLTAIFQKHKTRFVAFVEVSELEILEATGRDPGITKVHRQLRRLHRDGFELGLHLHPQWYNACYDSGKWRLDYDDYNLCTLPRTRIVQIVDRAISHLRGVVGVEGFTPFSFRAGNWLFQPTVTAADVLAQRGIKVDSSVFKGGRQHEYHLDYRKASKNGYCWRFSESVDTADPNGALVEFPIYTRMVPFWRLLTGKRLGLQRKGSSGSSIRKTDFYRYWDLMRFRYPLKLDFCRMRIDELTRMVDAVIAEDTRDPASFKPIVAIGHTKDLEDCRTTESFLSYLGHRGIPVTTFEQAYDHCATPAENRASRSTA
jgi:hypothetical protein